MLPRVSRQEGSSSEDVHPLRSRRCPWFMVDENSVAPTAGAIGGDSSRPWPTLASGFEQARAREDSLDRLVEWPAQRALLGDVTGLAVLDAGCGNGAKIAQLASDGA